jgi:hypothetical protein
MGQIIIPTDKKIKGPWLLDKNSLDELNETLVIIEEKLFESFNILVDKTAESKLEEYQRWDEEIDIERAKQKVKESYSFEKSDKYVLVITQQGKKIKEDNLSSLLKGSQIDEFNPTELRVHIEKGPCEFTLEVSTRYDGELETRIKSMDDSIFNDINYEISKWIDKHKPNLVMQKWSSWFPFAAFPIFMMLIFTTPFFLKDKADIYKTELAKESNLLLKDGLTEAETTKAIEIILQRESGYIPETFNPDITINKTVGNIWLYTGVALIILLIRPRTVIGLGKNKWKVGFYRKWTYFVLVFIPLSIAFPVIRSRIF